MSTDSADPRSTCSCFFLHHAANNPKHPITFDPELNEFHIENSDGYSIIEYCPFCGGATPESLRDDFFAIVPLEEENRLRALAEKYHSMADLAAAFGPPDEDRHTLTYRNLSTTADVVVFMVNNTWGGISCHPKQIKPGGEKNLTTNS